MLQRLAYIPFLLVELIVTTLRKCTGIAMVFQNRATVFG
jgi:hypothetical protein